MNTVTVKEIFEIDGETYVQNEVPPIQQSRFTRFKESILWENWKVILTIIGTIELIIKILPEIVIVE